MRCVLCQQVILLLTPPGQEVLLEVDLCGPTPLAPLPPPAPPGLDLHLHLQQDQDPQLVM